MPGFDRKYPNGRLSADDDGATNVGIASDLDHKVVYFKFEHRIVWFAVNFDSGLPILMTLAKHLSNISGKVIEVTVNDD